MKLTKSIFFCVLSTCFLLQGAAFAESEDFARLPAELETAINEQIAKEFDGAHTYLQLSSHFAESSLDGFAHFFTAQYYEELNHARMLMDFVQRKNGVVTLKNVELEALSTQTPRSAFEASLGLEEIQTERLTNLQRLATELGSAESRTFLDWFLTEQVQEENMFQRLVDRLTLVEGSPQGLLMIDTELQARIMPVIFVPPAP